MKNASEWASRVWAPSTSMRPVGVPSSSRSTSREWSEPIQKMLGSSRSMKAAHCRPKMSAEVWECTCHTALPGPNQPGSPSGSTNSSPRKNRRRMSLSKSDRTFSSTI